MEPTAHFTLGTTYFNLLQYENAIKHFERAEEHNPDDYEVLVNLALCHDRLNHHNKAENYYRRVLALDPKSDEICLKLANVCLKQNKIDESVLFYDKAIEINPNNVVAISNKASTYNIIVAIIYVYCLAYFLLRCTMATS